MKTKMSFNHWVPYNTYERSTKLCRREVIQIIAGQLKRSTNECTPITIHSRSCE